jgi:uncharacterized membrane protein YciS (DUF1049 family)
MKLEINLHFVLIIFSVMVWLSAIYMKIVVRQLKKQISAANNMEYLGKSRCEGANRNFNIMNKFYKIVLVGLLILIAVIIADEVFRMFVFFSNASARDETIVQLLSKLFNVNLVLGLFASSGFWYMVRDVRDYSGDLARKCKELNQ